jgi:hypothetical protein
VWVGLGDSHRYEWGRSARKQAEEGTRAGITPPRVFLYVLVMPDGATKQRARKVLDKLLLVGIAVAIIAPIAVLYAMHKDPPNVCQSGEDLALLDEDEELVVTKGLTDADVTQLDRFTSLRDLQLHFSDVTDAGMPHVGRHTGLRHLVLAADGISDKGIIEIAPLVELEDLALMGCTKVTTAGLAFLPKFAGLKVLLLHRLAAVDDGMGATLLRCKALERLELQNLRGITDRTMAEIAKMNWLTGLAIELCPQITNESVKLMAGMANLESLSLIGVDTLTDEVMLELAKLKKLKQLNLPERSKISKEALDQLKAALPGCKFNL